MPFDPVDPRLDLVALEERVLAQWREHDVFAESLRRRADAPEWVFYEGPPTANGRPGIHHVWARLFKDIYPRFHTMRGKYVARKAGWDCHGLPVEVEVEKELGFSGKPQIEDYGIEAFNRRCRESVQRYVEDWSSMTSRIGMWLDLSDAYTTMSNPFIESVWWQFHEMWDKGLIYEGSKVVPYCGRCGTALSSHELGQPGAYQDVTEDSVYVRFPVIDADFDLLVWTTTPWTLVSNVGAAVGPDVPYVRIRVGEGRDLVLAANRVEALFGEQATIVAELGAADLVDLRYERPFDWLPAEGDGWRVVAADFVTVDDGSGIVHLAPAFGEIDREVGEAAGLPMLNPVNAQARFDESVPLVAGRFVKDADATLIDELRAGGRLVQVMPYEHSYPHCWRCGTPLIYWAKPTWFARTSQLKDTLLAENEEIGWHPEHIRHGRFGDWLANNVDWALSRDRFWGTPIPVWRCTDCGHDTCVGSVEDLAARAGKDLADLDLHRPFVDDIEIACEHCGERAVRVEPVLDAWFDSGAMPAAQWHYPFENREIFERRFPADFICEAIDQTRGWFYSLLAVNTLVFGAAPYRDVVCLALLLDQDGQKMSKSKGNVVDPWSVLTTRGADALRWNFAYASSPWTPKRVYLENIDETTNRFLVTLWNTYVFFVTYANLDGWEPTAGADSANASPSEHVMDRWIRSRLHSTLQTATTAFEDFDALRATQAIDEFVDDLSNWYVRRSRPRFWKASDAAAHAVLHECLTIVTQMLAPVTPFTADALYQNLAGTDRSVHLTDWPEPDARAIHPELETEMRLARELVSLGLAARAESKLKVRQPLPRAIALIPDGAGLGPTVSAEIADALNVKSIETVTTLDGLLDYTVLPNFRALGPKVGPLLPRVKELLATVDGSAVQRALDTGGVFSLDVDGTVVDLTADELQIRAASHEELALAQVGSLAVAIDTALTEELRREGRAREVVRVINDARKSAGFAIADRIELVIEAQGVLLEAVTEYGEWIAGEVLAVRFSTGTVGTDGIDATIDGHALRASLTLA